VTDADQNFVQVLATVLVGTFIAYSVDLRSPRKVLRVREASSQRLVRGVYGFAVGYTALVPFLTVVGLVLLVAAVTGDVLSPAIKLITAVAAVVSISSLGFAPLAERAVDWLFAQRDDGTSDSATSDAET
jgi:hypothetical protein